MTIARWDPFRDFGFATADTWMPPVDIFQNGDQELVLKAELPDMAREDIDITVENFVLTIKGEKKFSNRDNSSLPIYLNLISRFVVDIPEELIAAI